MQATKETGRTQKAARSRAVRPLRLGGFHRVSRVGGRDDKLRSPELARAAVDRWLEFPDGAASDGARLEEWRVSLDSSGDKSDQDAELEELIVAVELGELDGIVVAKLDRLSRLPARRRLDLLERIGPARLFSATESNDLSTPEGRMVRELFFLLARMEWEKANENLVAAKRAAVERGAYIANTAPYGYRFGELHRLELVEAEAAVVRELFELRATGASWGIVLELFEARTGRRSHRQTVAHMLKNEAYIGAVVYGSENEGTLLRNDSAHPAAVELDLWERVQAVNDERAGLGPGEGHHAGAPVSLLAGLARCEGCGRGLVKSAGSKGRRDVYKCPNTAARCSARASVPLEELDAYVVEELFAWAGATADEEVVVELDRREDRAGADYRLAEAERLADEYEENVELELELGAARYAKGRQARRALVERRRSERDAIGEASELEEIRTTLRHVWPELELEERRRLLGTVLFALVVRKTPRAGAPVVERASLSFEVVGAMPEASGEN